MLRLSATAHRRATAVLALAASLLAAPCAAPAQTVETLVSNVRSSSTTTASMVGQPFTTGANPGGYTLTSVDLSLASGASPSDVLVRIAPDGARGRPDTSDASKLVTLSAPAEPRSRAVNTYTAPAGATLSARTTYHVLVTNAAGTGILGAQAAFTTGDATETGAEGWSIGNTRYFKADPSATAWRSSGGVLQIAIKGYANNNAPTVVVEIPDRMAVEGAAFRYTVP